MIWVIDASVALRWFLEEETHQSADEVLKKVVEDPCRFTVPELFAFEVYAVLQRLHPDGLRVFRKGIIPLLQGGSAQASHDRRTRRQSEPFRQKGPYRI